MTAKENDSQRDSESYSARERQRQTKIRRDIDSERKDKER